MPLSQSQKSLIQRARHVGGSDMAVPLDNAAASYLLSRVIIDLDLHKRFPASPNAIPPFFETTPVSSLKLPGVDFDALADALFTSVPDADTYFACLAALLKSRLKFERILQRQPFPTMDQVGPRGLLQYGTLSSAALAALVFWRKWTYDIDNRAAQETGYLFEPIVAAAIGGASVSAAKSPVRRTDDHSKGRQVDCIKGKMAYEFKLRVTIAASGQGRWDEELSFPKDCANSEYVPVLLVLDSTENAKLAELVAAFETVGGHAHVGDSAWHTLETQAGAVMSVFLERYVRRPLASLLTFATDKLPDLHVSQGAQSITIRVGGESLTIPRM